jgi:hypothetical protein
VDLEEVLRLVADAGIRLTLEDGDRLIARPTQAVTPEMLALLRAHKAALIAAMTPVKTETEVFALAAEHFGRCVAPGDGSPGGGAAPQGAARRGLVAKWSREFGYVSVHDPTTGEWHDIATAEAPAWAKGEAWTRKALWKAGNRRAYDLTAADMSKFWEDELPPVEEGIVEEHELPDD